MDGQNAQEKVINTQLDKPLQLKELNGSSNISINSIKTYKSEDSGKVNYPNFNIFVQKQQKQQHQLYSQSLSRSVQQNQYQILPDNILSKSVYQSIQKQDENGKSETDNHHHDPQIFTSPQVQLNFSKQQAFSDSISTKSNLAIRLNQIKDKKIKNHETNLKLIREALEQQQGNQTTNQLITLLTQNIQARSVEEMIESNNTDNFSVTLIFVKIIGIIGSIFGILMFIFRFFVGLRLLVHVNPVISFSVVELFAIAAILLIYKMFLYIPHSIGQQIENFYLLIILQYLFSEKQISLIGKSKKSIKILVLSLSILLISICIYVFYLK